jgi:hypothetical protein
MPKLVQITSNQSNYQLDTTYKYVSMLVVGKGYVVPYSATTPTGTGGGSGMVVYVKNWQTKSSFGYYNRINTISFGDTYTLLEVDRAINANGSIQHHYHQIQAGNANSRDGAALVAWIANVGEPSQSDWTSQLDGYGSNAGSNSYLYGGGGSNGNANNSNGGSGGDGTFGHQGGTGGTAVTKGTIIPLNSIFGGSGLGGGSYGSGTLSYYGSAGGYSGGDTGGYGQGVSYRWNYQSAGLVCLYYHNDPI